jgi:hypothetical protein
MSITARVPAKLARLQELHNNGCTYAEMAHELGVSVPTITRQLRRLRQSKDDHFQPYDVRLSGSYGNNSDYLAARIKRDHPEIAEKIEDYPSIYAAAKTAGIVRNKTLLDRLLADWEKASASERADFLKEIGAIQTVT